MEMFSEPVDFSKYQYKYPVFFRHSEFGNVVDDMKNKGNPLESNINLCEHDY